MKTLLIGILLVLSTSVCVAGEKSQPLDKVDKVDKAIIKHLDALTFQYFGTPIPIEQKHQLGYAYAECGAYYTIVIGLLYDDTEKLLTNEEQETKQVLQAFLIQMVYSAKYFLNTDLESTRQIVRANINTIMLLNTKANRINLNAINDTFDASCAMMVTNTKHAIKFFYEAQVP